MANAEAILALREACAQVKCSNAVQQYIVHIAKATREDRSVALGASPRASLMLMQAAMARALMQGRDYVLPDDVQHMAVPVLAHRVIVRGAYGRTDKSEEAIQEVLRQAAVPTESGER